MRLSQRHFKMRICDYHLSFSKMALGPPRGVGAFQHVLLLLFVLQMQNTLFSTIVAVICAVFFCRRKALIHFQKACLHILSHFLSCFGNCNGNGKQVDCVHQCPRGHHHSQSSIHHLWSSWSSGSTFASLTSVKSSVGILTHQGHIRKVGGF